MTGRDAGGHDEAGVAALVHARIAEAGSLRALAREWGVSPAYLSDLTNGRRGPGPKILGPLGLVREKIVRYVPAKKARRK